MTSVEIGLLSFPVLLGLIFLRAPIGLAMLIVGLGGMVLATGSQAMVMSKLKTEVYGIFSNYSLSIVPIILFAQIRGDVLQDPDQRACRMHQV